MKDAALAGLHKRITGARGKDFIATKAAVYATQVYLILFHFVRKFGKGGQSVVVNHSRGTAPGKLAENYHDVVLLHVHAAHPHAVGFLTRERLAFFIVGL